MHGSGGGGWAWRETLAGLRAHGHEAYAPTLTGMGERIHLAGPAVGLDTHVLDVANVLKYEDLRDAVLVGHSYAGMVVTGVAERAPERLRHLVYLDALVPADGQAARDLYPAAVRAAFDAAARTHGEGWRVPQGPEAGSRASPHLLRAFAQPLAVRNPAAAAVPRTYVACTAREPDPLLLPVEATAARLRCAPGWGYRELPTGHAPMLSAPHALTALLLEWAADPRPGGGAPAVARAPRAEGNLPPESRRYLGAGARLAFRSGAACAPRPRASGAGQLPTYTRRSGQPRGLPEGPAAAAMSVAPAMARPPGPTETAARHA